MSPPLFSFFLSKLYKSYRSLAFHAYSINSQSNSIQVPNCATKFKKLVVSLWVSLCSASFFVFHYIHFLFFFLFVFLFRVWWHRLGQWIHRWNRLKMYLLLFGMNWRTFFFSLWNEWFNRWLVFSIADSILLIQMLIIDFKYMPVAGAPITGLTLNVLDHQFYPRSSEWNLTQ